MGKVVSSRENLREVGNVDDVGGGALVSGRASLLLLVKLVVEEEVLVIVRYHTLMSIGSTIVGGAGQLPGHGAAVNVDDGEGILVEVEADLLALVLDLGATVDDALGIVDIAVGRNAASVLGALGVAHVDHPQAGTALESVLGADGNDEVRLFVGDNVVAAAEAVEMGSQVILDAEGGGLLGVDLEQLGQVEDLEAVAFGLRADVGVVANDLDVTPDGVVSLGGQATQVRKAAVLLDLDKGSAVGLSNQSKLAAAGGVGPS